MSTNPYTNANIFTSNAVPQFEIDNCNFINVNRKTRNISNYTSKGIKKAQASDPIRSQEDLNRVWYYLDHLPSTFKNDRNRLLFKLGCTVGLRISDLLRIEVNQIIDDRFLYSTVHLFEQKTGKSKTIKLTKENQDMICKFVQKYHMQPSQYLFASRQDAVTAINRSEIYRFIRKIESDLKLPYHMGTHSMRKTFAYWIIMQHPNDVSIMNALQKVFNHSSMATTLFYAGVTQEHLNTLYDDISDLVHNGKMVYEANRQEVERMMATLDLDD